MSLDIVSIRWPFKSTVAAEELGFVFDDEADGRLADVGTPERV